MGATDDFGQRQLVPGSVVGVRRFSVDTLGRLTGVTHQQVWRPGVNEAKCDGSGGRLGMGYVTGGVAGMRVYYHSTATAEPPSPDSAARHTHRCGSKTDEKGREHGCLCGYYGFFADDPDNHGYGRGDLTGIIEGTGVATVGRKGFRAEKARIVALVKPERRRQHNPVKQWVIDRGHNTGATVAFLGCLAIAFGTMGTIVLAQMSLFGLFMLAFIALGVWLIWCAETGLNRRVYDRATDERAVDWAQVRRNYPDVPVYPSLRAALARHPLSEPPPAPSPETLGDAFWTADAP